MGLTVLTLTLLRLGWHRASPPPVPRETGWQRALARWTHGALLALLLLQPLAGWVDASATGIPTVVYGVFTAPAIAPPSEAWDAAGFLAHRLFGSALATLIALHVAGALWGEFGRRDRTLSRMLGRG